MATSLIESDQQWDAPNGWAPLQWMAVVGLRNYGFDKLAETIAMRWVGENIAGYEKEAKLVEKYNVSTTGGDEGGGGEYATQIGFGWTNGVLVALGDLYPALHQEINRAVPATRAPVCVSARHRDPDRLPKVTRQIRYFVNLINGICAVWGVKSGGVPFRDANSHPALSTRTC